MGRKTPQKESGDLQLFLVSYMVHCPEIGHMSEGGEENIKKTRQTVLDKEMELKSVVKIELLFYSLLRPYTVNHSG